MVHWRADRWRSMYRRDPLDARHVTIYKAEVIKTFADKRTRDLYVTGRARRLPSDLAARAARKLEYVDLATRLDDLKVPPGNRLHALGGDRKGQHAIAVNDQWRICFRFCDGDAYDVELCDYH
jgi:proteic killer suppression protein